jgi:GMP synthase-like glutamine amidotransferase
VKPIAIFRHARTEEPGYFAEFLDQNSIPWHLIKIDAGDAVPANVSGFTGLVFMGGPMSVNDSLPWIAPTLALIREAVARDVSVLGHCLGGQLMSKALGGVVTQAPVKEIGWGEVEASEHPTARHWLGAVERFNSFHWHGEMFSIPPGATRIAGNAHCENQVFALGKHLGMQCHVEMTIPMIESWCASGAREIAASPSPAVQSPAIIQMDLPNRVDALNRVAAGLYTRWIEGLRRD